MRVIVLHNLDDLVATGLPYSTQDKPFTTFWNECGQPARINYVLDNGLNPIYMMGKIKTLFQEREREGEENASIFAERMP